MVFKSLTQKRITLSIACVLVVERKGDIYYIRNWIDKYAIKTFSGLPAEAKEQYRNAVSYYEYDVKGDAWSVKHGSDPFPGQDKIYYFTVGKQFDAEMLDGSKFKVSILLLQEFRNI